MRKIYCLFFLIILFVSPVKSQYFEEEKSLCFGVKAGASYSSIGNIHSMIIPENYFSGYSFDEKFTINPYANLFINYKLEETIIALEGGLSYYQIGSKSQYSDVKGLNYDLKFQYDYIGLEGYVRTYYYKGFNVAAGMRIGFNINPNNLKYTSNGQSLNINPPLDSDIKVEQGMRQVLKGKNNIAAGIILGYESPKGWLVDLSYHYGLNDAIETQTNSVNFIENTNNTHSIQLTIGWLFSFKGSNF